MLRDNVLSKSLDFVENERKKYRNDSDSWTILIILEGLLKRLTEINYWQETIRFVQQVIFFFNERLYQVSYAYYFLKSIDNESF